MNLYITLSRFFFFFFFFGVGGNVGPQISKRDNKFCNDHCIRDVVLTIIFFFPPSLISVQGRETWPERILPVVPSAGKIPSPTSSLGTKSAHRYGSLVMRVISEFFLPGNYLLGIVHSLAIFLRPY